MIEKLFHNVNQTIEFDKNQILHVIAPTNDIKYYPFINLKNDSRYNLYIYSTNPQNNNIKPFISIEPYSELSFLNPVEVSTDGLFIETIYNSNVISNNVLTNIDNIYLKSKIYINYSDINYNWDCKNYKILPFNILSNKFLINNYSADLVNP